MILFKFLLSHPCWRPEGAAQHTAPEHETWKIQVGQRLDSSRCYAWQKLEPGVELEAISMCCQELIQEFGYPQITSSLTPIFSPLHQLSIYPELEIRISREVRNL